MKVNKGKKKAMKSIVYVRFMHLTCPICLNVYSDQLVLGRRRKLIKMKDNKDKKGNGKALYLFRFTHLRLFSHNPIMHVA